MISLFKPNDSLKVELGKNFTIEIYALENDAKPLEMVWISPGTFTMGAPLSERGRRTDEDQFEVTITAGFWLSRYLITQAQYRYLIAEIPPREIEHVNYPIRGINWYEALTFCWELKRITDWAFTHLGGHYHFTLPTEVQWEYACRAGTQTTYYNGNSENEIGNIAWYSANSEGRIHPVGEKLPNDWGLYDMLGLADEWCLTEPVDYPKKASTDWTPSWHSEVHSEARFGRVQRGGSINAKADGVRCANRDYMEPITNVGSIRLCLSNVDYKLNLD